MRDIVICDENRAHFKCKHINCFDCYSRTIRCQHIKRNYSIEMHHDVGLSQVLLHEKQIAPSINDTFAILKVLKFAEKKGKKINRLSFDLHERANISSRGMVIQMLSILWGKRRDDRRR